MWTKGLLALALAGVLLGAGGCYGAEELNRLAIVGAIGFDVAPEGVRVVIQIVRPTASTAAPSSSGGGGSASGTPSIFVIEATGRNPAEAISLAQTKISRRLYLSQAQLVVLSDRLLKAGVLPTADWLTRNRQLREDVSVVTTHDDLAQFLSIGTPLAPSPSVAWKALLDRRYALTLSIVQFANSFVSQDADGYLSVVGFEPLPDASGAGGGGGSGKKPAESPRLLGIALFQRNKYLGDVDLRTARSLNWILNRLSPFATVTAPLSFICPTDAACPRGDAAPALPDQNINRLTPEETVAPGSDTISVHVQEAASRKSVRLDPDGRLHFTIDIDAVDALAANGAGMHVEKPEVVAKIDRGLDAYLEKTLRQDLDRFRTMGADPVGFGALVMAKLPRYWREHHLEWHTAFQRAEFTVNVHFRTVRTGLTNDPIGYLDQEMRQ